MLVLANWPGWSVKYFDWQRPYSIEESYEYGWPSVYLRRAKFGPSPTGAAIVACSPWRLIDNNVIEFSTPALMCDIAAGLGIVALAVVLIRVRRRKRRLWFQFHLWELLAFVTICSIGLSFFAVRRKEYVEEEKVRVRLVSSWDGFHMNSVEAPDGPDWLLPLLGERLYRELFVRVFQAESNGADLREVVRLRKLHVLILHRPNQDQVGLLTSLPELESIQFIGPWGSGDRVIEIPRLPRLRALSFDEPIGLGEDHFVNAARRSGVKFKLDRLTLSPTRVDDETLPSVARIKTLVSLGFSNAHITDAGLESLMDLRELRELQLENTLVTAEGVRRLKEALPSCRIDWSPRSPDEDTTEK
jgi:hypothetical protein